MRISSAFRALRKAPLAEVGGRLMCEFYVHGERGCPYGTPFGGLRGGYLDAPNFINGTVSPGGAARHLTRAERGIYRGLR